MKIGLRLWILIFVLVLSIIAINPFLSLKKGVAVDDIIVNSSAEKAGLRSGEIIKEINGKKIKNIDDYSKVIGEIFANTNNETKIRVEIMTDKDSYVLLADKPEWTVKSLPKSRLKLGLDLQGGSRAVVKPVEEVSAQNMENIISILNNRFNRYGITDAKITKAGDLEGNRYVVIEIAGVSPKELRELILSQGKFEAKIGNETVFVGGGADITSVCQSAECSGIVSCNKVSDGEICKFQFGIYLSPEAAKRHAAITANLVSNASNPQYLNETLDLYLDDKLVDSLWISIDLKGQETTQVAISGSGFGVSRQEAYENAEKNMKKLQTILITGSLPIKLKIEKLDSVSALLGKEILRNVTITSLLIILAVSLLIFIRYRKISFALPVILTMLSEIVIILGVAAFIKWNLDLASIAGILITLGTGVDAQIIILDETKTETRYSLKERIKRSFAIILGSFATTFVAMLPLWQAGAGLLKGFALTTIIGITIGIFITRPAFSEIISKIKGIE